MGEIDNQSIIKQLTTKMDQLIEIKEYYGKQVVSARELHTFLGCKKDFSNWIRHRIEKYGLQEKVDYVLVNSDTSSNGGIYAQMGENRKGGAGRKSIEYALTMDAAKQLAMVEGNEKGKEARLYFINCEKTLKAVVAPKTEDVILMEAMAILNKRIEAHEAKVAQLQESNGKLRVSHTILKQISGTEELLSMDEVAKIVNHKGVGRNNLFRILREKHILNSQNVPLQEYINRDYFKLKEKLIQRSAGDFMVKTTLCTQKGLMYICKILNIDPPTYSITKAQ